MLNETTIVEENVRIQSQGRTLEGLLTYPSDHPLGSALIAGPHPFLGGDMHNNIVSALSKTLASKGAVALTFNYGGVGESEGGPADWPAVMSAFWKDGTFVEEQDWAYDAGAATTALQHWSDAPLVLIGYSFGCWAIANHLQASHATAIVMISPNPKQHAFEQLSESRVPLLLIHSNNDFTCGESEMIAWSDTIREPKKRVQLSAGEHFFRGHEEEVADIVLTFMRHHNILPAK